MLKNTIPFLAIQVLNGSEDSFNQAFRISSILFAVPGSISASSSVPSISTGTDIPSSNLKIRLSYVLKEEHFIRDYILIEDEKQTQQSNEDKDDTSGEGKGESFVPGGKKYKEVIQGKVQLPYEIKEYLGAAH